MRWPWQRRKPAPEPEWTDPLNPHGDGTLRPGDPVYEAAMRGSVVHGTFGPDSWELKETPAPVCPDCGHTAHIGRCPARLDCDCEKLPEAMENLTRVDIPENPFFPSSTSDEGQTGLDKVREAIDRARGGPPPPPPPEAWA